jgi:hypothetical protein
LVPGAIAATSADSRMKNPGGSGAAAAGGDVDDDGHRARRFDLFDDLARRIDEASRSVDLDQDGLIVVSGGGVERAR